MASLWVQADLDALEAALKSPERRVRFTDGREVEYRSIAEMQQARELIIGVLTNASPTQPIRHTRFFSTKGL